MKEKLIRIWQLKMALIIPFVQSRVVLNKLHSLKLLNLHYGLYILMQKALILNTCRIQGVPGGKDLTSGECFLGQTIPI